MGFDVFGTLVTESSGDEMGDLTHYGLFGDKWYDKSAKVIKMIKELGGEIIFIGGGNILGDEIMRAFNVGVKFHLMKGPPGAASRFLNLATEFQEKGFENFEELKKKLSSSFFSVTRDCSKNLL
jgi:hypothetical protein